MPKSTQQYLDILEIKEDTLILKDGTLRAVLLVASHNFSLKSEDEQNALVSGYITMLNQLEYPLQVLIQSRMMHIDNYLNNLEERARVETNNLLKLQTQEYVKFVREIVTLGNIMTKKFFVIVPYNPDGDARSGFFSRLMGILAPTKIIHLREEKFAHHKAELDKRVSDVMSGLANISLNPIRLETKSLIELQYATYNPVVSEIQKVGNIGELQVEG